MPEVNLFNGGVNLHKDARKLDTNEFIGVADAEISSGSVVSLENNSFVQSNVSPVLVDYKNEIVSGSGSLLKFTKALNYLIRSDGEFPQYTVGKRTVIDNRLEWFPLQVTAPEIKPTLERQKLTMDVSLTGDATTGTSAIRLYKYVIVLDGVPHEFNYDCLELDKVINLALDTIVSVEVPTPTTIAVYRQTDINVLDGCISPANLLTNDSAILCRDTVRPEYQAYISRSLQFDYNTAVRQAFYDTLLTWGNTGAFTMDLHYLEPTIACNFRTGASPASGYTVTATKHSSRPQRSYVVEATFIGKRVVGIHYEFTLKMAISYSSLAKASFSIDISPYGYRIYSVAESTLVKITNIPRSIVWPIVESGSSTSTTMTDTRLDTSLVGDFQYAITYETATGVETDAGEYSDIASSIGSAIRVSIPEIPSPPAGTTKVNLYRYNSNLCGGQTKFLRVIQILIGDLPTVVVDYTAVGDLGGIMPIKRARPIPLDLLYVTSYKGRVFGVTKDYNFTDVVYTPAIADEYPTTPLEYGTVWRSTVQYIYTWGDLEGQTIEVDGQILYRNNMWELIAEDHQDLSDYTTLRWSNLGDPLIWASVNFLNMDKVITGIGTTSNGLLLFHTAETHALLGTESNNFTKRIISKSHGCIDFRSISEWQGNCIFGSLDGIAMSNGGSVELISFGKLGHLSLMQSDVDDIYNVDNSDVLSSAVVGNQYFLLFKAGYIIKLDMSTGVYTTITSLGIQGIAAVNGNLLGSQGSQDLYMIPFSLFGEKTYNITTGLITDGAISNVKEYDKIRVSLEGTGHITVTLDGQDVIENKQLTAPLTVVGIPNEKNKALSIQFSISGVGSLHSIEYSVKGRENG